MTVYPKLESDKPVETIEVEAAGRQLSRLSGLPKIDYLFRGSIGLSWTYLASIEMWLRALALVIVLALLLPAGLILVGLTGFFLIPWILLITAVAPRALNSLVKAGSAKAIRAGMSGQVSREVGEYLMQVDELHPWEKLGVTERVGNWIPPSAQDIRLFALVVGSTLLILGGTAFLVIPGILVALKLSVAVPVQVLEGRRPFSAMARSAQLTSDRLGEALLVFFLPIVWLALSNLMFFAPAIRAESGLAALLTLASPFVFLISILSFLGASVYLYARLGIHSVAESEGAV